MVRTQGQRQNKGARGSKEGFFPVVVAGSMALDVLILDFQFPERPEDKLLLFKAVLWCNLREMICFKKPRADPTALGRHYICRLTLVSAANAEQWRQRAWGAGICCVPRAARARGSFSSGWGKQEDG